MAFEISHHTQLLFQVLAKSVDHNFWPLELFLRQWHLSSLTRTWTKCQENTHKCSKVWIINLMQGRALSLNQRLKTNEAQWHSTLQHSIKRKRLLNAVSLDIGWNPGPHKVLFSREAPSNLRSWMGLNPILTHYWAWVKFIPRANKFNFDFFSFRLCFSNCLHSFSIFSCSFCHKY